MDRKIVDREIDGRIIPAKGDGAARTLQGWDLFYLCAVKAVRTDLNHAYRKRLREEIVSAAARGKPEARIGYFHVSLGEIEAELGDRLAALEAARRDHVEVRGDVLAGQPVLKGTRLAVRHVAELVKRGATPQALREDYDLSEAQVRAAVVYDQAAPRRGRPAAGGRRASHVPAAR